MVCVDVHVSSETNPHMVHFIFSAPVVHALLCPDRED